MDYLANFILTPSSGSFGDLPTFFSGMYAYLSESTSMENRSFRMVLIDIFLGLVGDSVVNGRLMGDIRASYS